MAKLAVRPALVAIAAAAALIAAGCGSSGRTDLGSAIEGPPPANAPAKVAKPLTKPQGQAVLDELPALPAASAQQPGANFVGSSKETLAQFIAQVSDDVSSVWDASLTKGGYSFSPAKLVEVGPGQHAVSGCGHTVVSLDPVGPFYCPPDASIYMPLQLMDRYIYRKYGDFAVAYAVSHEWGHRIQDLLGILDLKARGKILTIQTETQADCFAGLWARTAYRRGLLEKGDVQEAIKVTDLVGDAVGTPEEAPGAHGLAGLRSAWFMTGYRSGKFGDCKTFE